MAVDLLKLQELAAAAIRKLDPKSPGWEKAMQGVIARGHTAAHLMGVAERAGVNVDSGLFRGLSKAERDDIKKAVSTQLEYLTRFAAQRGSLSEAQIKARAQLYAGATRGTFFSSRYPGLTQYPGDGQTACLTNCKCSLDERADGVHWRLNAGESCDDCEAMAAGSPY